MTESVYQTRIVVAYGTHIMHVLHILLTGKWDPISLLDDNDLWISSESFITATSHAVNAAEAISDILEYDPDLSFMPFFFGVYLLQGSFLLLLIADKLQGEASPSVVKACETIVRAHEACVVTLNTEYQVRHPPLPISPTLTETIIFY
ncbi:putative transcriptional activator xlnr [Phaeomoniella chlamydospora]|uniref:Putative transcriptional activator xlnr n=1 Tax=Phaeomoniella chlamydospora TaxID=158046 RepID=A0A0G2GCU1_PHACM|nr:putative transcriptional activator xlnr [Phaeomoniella chlamydospora]